MDANPRGAKRVSSGLRGSSDPVSGFCRELSLTFPGSFSLFECSVAPTEMFRLMVGGKRLRG